MNENIIKFYLLTNRLKEKIRTGWTEVNISGERLESVAEHIYGCLMLAIAIDSEYHLDVDIGKCLKMIALHELEETIMKDFTIRDGLTKEEKKERGRKCVIEATDGLIKQNEIVNLLDEFNEYKTKEAIFCYHIDKIECDFQAKVYDKAGRFSLEEAINDVQYFDIDDKENFIKKIHTASDSWIEFDRHLYDDDKVFKELLNDIQKI